MTNDDLLAAALAYARSGAPVATCRICGAGLKVGGRGRPQVYCDAHSRDRARVKFPSLYPFDGVHCRHCRAVLRPDSRPGHPREHCYTCRPPYGPHSAPWADLEDQG